MVAKPKVEFSTLSHSFSENLNALRVFANHIGQFADEYDRGAVSSLTSTLSSLFPGALKVKSTSVELSAGPNLASGETNEQTPATRPDEEAIKQEVERVLSEPAARDTLLEAILAVSKKAPVQGTLLRQGALVALVSSFENVVAQLVHAFYERYPNALPAEERTLTLSDLRQIGSVEDAEFLIVTKEADSVLRERLENQLNYFTKRPKIDLDNLSGYWNDLIEIDQRRNLYVHNQGRVNKIYLQQVAPDLVAKFGATDGSPIGISEQYLADALDIVDLAGTILIQLCWRKWDKEAGEASDRYLMDQIYDALQAQRHRYVMQSAAFAKQLKFEEDASSRIVCINHAIALRDSGETDRIEQELQCFDWSAASLKFQVALHAVRGKQEQFLVTLPKAFASG